MISTHILDTSIGAPASGVAVKLEKQEGKDWSTISSGFTNADGRLQFDVEIQPGNHRIVFEIEDYLKKSGKEFFFLNVPVSFKIENTKRNYHVPLLLNPFGFSTYRGS
ncbi:MAG: hydroxyisourate hydrolase [Xanthomonadaceae bacterium]|nr:hydroxyisourate hydrolase [Xanthomonadaceae bacterium]